MEDLIEVHIRPGARDEEKIVLEGKGDETEDPEIPAGNVIIVIGEQVAYLVLIETIFLGTSSICSQR